MQAPRVDQINRDSRAIKQGDWFLALSGENFNGHSFIQQALEGGAAGFFYEHRWAHLVPSQVLERGIAVADTLTAFQHIATGWRADYLTATTLFALTGSVGKTTTKDMMSCILAAAGNSYSNKKNFNNEIGVPLTLTQLRPDHEFAILEFGARHVGDIALLNQIAQPNIVCLLNVGSAHLGIFGSKENLLNTKFEIFSASRPDSVWITNADDENIQTKRRELKKGTVLFGKAQDAVIRLLRTEKLADNSMSVVIAVNNIEYEWRLTSYHEAYAASLSACVAMAHAAGIDLEAIQEGLNSFIPSPGRFFTHKLGPTTIIDDTYNANPESMRKGIETLQKLYPEDDKVIILGDMLELGEDAGSLHAALGDYVALNSGFSLFCAVGDCSQHTAHALLQAGVSPAKVKHFATSSHLIEEINSIARAGRVYYLKGSNSIKLNKVVDVLLTNLS
jgi:UDP-N-acetylmuramoyl-tripeptide--D-alanyl-D-alanine ligase